MGCLHKVFATEIDVELFARRSAAARASASSSSPAQPRERCAFSIERAFPDLDDCVNRRFFDWPEAAPGAVRAFDLRDRL